MNLSHDQISNPGYYYYLNFPAFSVLVLVPLLKVKGTAAAGLDVLVLEIIGLNPNSSWGVKFNGDC